MNRTIRIYRIANVGVDFAWSQGIDCGSLIIGRLADGQLGVLNRKVVAVLEFFVVQLVGAVVENG